MYYNFRPIGAGSGGTVDLTNYYTKSQTDNRIDVELQRGEIEVGFNRAYSTAYTEFIYDGSGNLTNVNIYTNSGKGTQLYSKSITYTSGNVSQVTITDTQRAHSLTKNYTYSGGNLAQILITYGG